MSQGKDLIVNAAIEQEADVLVGELADGFRAFGAVGQAGGVAEVDDVFGGQQLLDGADDSQAADAGIEEAQGGVAHGREDEHRTPDVQQ